MISSVYRRHERDYESYCERLRRFLTDAYLLFNPYLCSDEKLLSAALRQRWGGEFALTQMVILEFTGIRTVTKGGNKIEYISYRIGDSDDTVEESLLSFTAKATALDDLRPVRHVINGRPIRDDLTVRRLIGKQVFVSRQIPTRRASGNYGRAFRMHRLNGRPDHDAEVIRKAMIEAKLEMLGRFMASPSASGYLDGVPSIPVDIVTPVNRLIDAIRRYPDATPGSALPTPH